MINIEDLLVIGYVWSKSILQQGWYSKEHNIIAKT